MGDHYIPQYYLKGFCKPNTPNIISRYEKGTRLVVTTGLKNVAQETSYYSRDVETFLTEDIEGPANPVLDKIREQRPITDEEKFILATYMITLLKRVPQSKTRLKQSAPKVVESVFGGLDEELARLQEASPAKVEIIQRHREEAKRLRMQYEANVPKEIWLKLIPPNATPRALATLNAMTWRFFTHSGSPAFLTSDNPIYFHLGIGIGHPNSEVTFPISSNTVLWATWRSSPSGDFLPASKKIVREINYRTASIATKYVFFAQEEKWVTNLANRKNFRLHRVN